MKIIISVLFIFTFPALLALDIDKDSTHVVELNNRSYSLLRSNPDSSKFLAQEALKISNRLSFKSGIGESNYNIGLFHFYKGEFDSTYHYWQLSLKIWKSLSNKRKEVRLLSNISMVLNELNKPVESIQYAKEVIKIYTEEQDSVQLASSYNNLGIIYKRLGDYRKSLESHNKALKIRLVIEDKEYLASSYVNLSSVYNLTKQLDSSNYALAKALELHTSNNNVRGMAITNSKLAEMYFLLDKFSLALEYINIAIVKGNEIEANHLLLEFYLWKAKVLLALNRLDEALEFVTKSNELASGKEFYREISPDELLSKIYFKKKDYQNAAIYFDKSLRKKDSVFQAFSANNIAEMKAKSYYELKEAELKYERQLEQERLEYIIEKQNLTRKGLLIVLFLVVLIAAVIIRAYVLIKRKNNILKQQQVEIEKLTQKQQEIIDLKTAELLSTQDSISKFAFMNAHELRGPIARILGIIHLSDNQNITEEELINGIKTSASELEEAVRKISEELNKH